MRQLFLRASYVKAEPISDEFLRRAYYAMRRAGLTFPYADRIEQRTAPAAPDPAAGTARLESALKKQPLFAHLDDAAIRSLADSARFELFGMGENIVKAGTPDEAFFVLLAGMVSLASESSERPVAHLSEGDFLGEMVLLSGEPSPVTATVEETATVLRIDGAAINHLVHRLPRFALEISQFIDDRRKLTQAA